jgi:AraC-like DNA-binding protein
MRSTGATLQDIADALGYSSASGVAKAIRVAMDRAIYIASDDERRQSVARLDRGLTKLEPGMNKPETAARSVEVMVKIEERRAKLLGLDAPEPTPPPVEVTVIFKGGASIDDI